MALDTDSTVDINEPKTRNITSGNYLYTAFARDVSVKTDEIGWAWLRTNLSNGDKDWANKDGRGSKAYDYTGPVSNAVPVAITFGE